MIKNNKIFLFSTVFIALALTFLYPKINSWFTKNPRNVGSSQNEEKTTVINALTPPKKVTQIENENINLSPKTEDGNEKNLPAEKILEVPFTSQAPYTDWSEPWQNACEEAAVLIVHHFLLGDGDKVIPKEQVTKELQEMINWQIKNYGTHRDLKAEEIANFTRKYLGYKNVKVIYDISIEDIKNEIAEGNPIIIPVAGRVLDNPNYAAPGPVYHNLVATGYTKDKIITNDPGTRKGKKFTYTYDNFYKSIHDFVEGANENPEKMLQGKKVMIVIKK